MLSVSWMLSPAEEEPTPARPDKRRWIKGKPEGHKTPNKYTKGDTVRLARSSFRGQFKPCKGRVGRVKESLRLKSPLTSYRAVAIYVVEGLHPKRDLRLLGEDLAPVPRETWELQHLTEILSK